MCKKSQRVNFFFFRIFKRKDEKPHLGFLWGACLQAHPWTRAPRCCTWHCSVYSDSINAAFWTKVSVCTMIQNENQCTDVTGRIHRLKEQG